MGRSMDILKANDCGSTNYILDFNFPLEFVSSTTPQCLRLLFLLTLSHFACTAKNKCME